MTWTSPSMMRKSDFPGSPISTIVCPDEYLTDSAAWAIRWRSAGSSPLKMGIWESIFGVRMRVASPVAWLGQH